MFDKNDKQKCKYRFEKKNALFISTINNLALKERIFQKYEEKKKCFNRNAVNV